MNGGQCINNFGSYTCICLPDYTGNNCEDGKMCTQSIFIFHGTLTLGDFK